MIAGTGTLHVGLQVVNLATGTKIYVKIIDLPVGKLNQLLSYTIIS